MSKRKGEGILGIHGREERLAAFPIANTFVWNEESCGCGNYLYPPEAQAITSMIAEFGPALQLQDAERTIVGDCVRREQGMEPAKDGSQNCSDERQGNPKNEQVGWYASEGVNINVLFSMILLALRGN